MVGVQDPPCASASVPARDAYRGRDRLPSDVPGSRLYGILPTGFVLPAASTKWHFYQAMLMANVDADDRERTKRFVHAVETETCSATSQVVEVTFVTPAERDAWTNAEFNVRHSKFILKASRSMVEEAEDGYDEEALRLKYQVHVVGRLDVGQHVVR